MDGLNTQNAVNSFLNTYTGLSNHFANQEQRKIDNQRMAERDQMARERHGLSLQAYEDNKAQVERANKIQDERLGMERERHGLGVQADKLNLDTASRQNDEAARAQFEAEGRRRVESYNRELGLIVKQMDVYDQINADGIIDDDERAFLAKNRMYDVEYLISDEFTSAAAVAKRVLSGELDYKSRESLDALGILIPEWTSGRQFNIRRIRQLHKGQEPGTLIPGVEVEGQDRERPLTVNGTSDDNDPIKQVREDDLLNTAMARVQLSEMLQTEQGRNVIRSEYKALQEQLAKKSGRDSKVPAKIQQAYTYLAEARKGGNDSITFEEAYARANGSSVSKHKYVTDYVEMRLKEQADNYIKPGDDGYKTSEQLEKEGIASYARVDGFSRDEGGDDGGLTEEEISNQLYQHLKDNPHEAEQEINNYRQLYGRDPEWAKEFDQVEPAEEATPKKTDQQILEELGVTTQAQAIARIAEIKAGLQGVTRRDVQDPQKGPQIKAMREELALLERAIKAPASNRGGHQLSAGGSLYGLSGPSIAGQ